MPDSLNPAERALELTRQLAAEGLEPLDRMLISQELRATADDLLARDAAAAHRAGYSWQEIGNALGISRQAAYQRFGGIRPASEPRPNQALTQLPIVVGELFAGFAAGRFDEACADFTPRMLEQVPVAAVRELWDECVETLGAYGWLGPVTMKANGALRIATATVRFEDGELLAKVAFNKSRKIAGLLLTHPGFTAADGFD